MDLLKKTAIFAPALQPEWGEEVRIFQTKEKYSVPDWSMDLIGDPAYGLTNQAIYNGMCRLIKCSPIEQLNSMLVKICIGHRGEEAIFLSYSEVTVEIPLTDYKNATNEMQQKQMPLQHQRYTTVFVRLFDSSFHSLHGALLTPFGKELYGFLMKNYMAEKCSVQFSKTTLPCLVTNIDVCKYQAEYFLTVKNGKLEIAPMTNESIATVFIGILANLPGWKDFAVKIHAECAKNRQMFVLIDTKYTDLNRAQAMHGKNDLVPVAMRYAMIWLILSIVLKEKTYQQILMSANKRLLVLCKIAKMPPRMISINEATVNTINSIKDNIMAFIDKIAEPLFSVDLPEETPNDKLLRIYVQKMIEGWGMHSFMSIEAFVFTSNKCAAHYDVEIQKEIAHYMKQCEAILRRLNGKPIAAYKLFYPNAPDIVLNDIKQLKWLAIKARIRNQTWSTTTDVHNEPGIDTNKLSLLVNTRIHSRATHSDGIIESQRRW